MTNFQPVSKTQHADKKWQRNPNFSFTAKDAVCPLVIKELPKAMANMPVAFLRTEDTYLLVAVQGLKPETNLYIDGNGKWLGKYIPANYRAYPFTLANNSEDEENLILCIDDDSGLVNNAQADQPFFKDDGELSELVQQVMGFLSELHASRQVTSRICELLSEHSLFRPWDLQIQYDEGTRKVEGLVCVDEAAFNKLTDDAFIELRQAGALPLIYGQLLSMQHIAVLANATQTRTKVAAQPLPDELNLDAVTDDGNISFDNL